MSSRAEQKAAAKAARQAKERELQAATRRKRLLVFGGVIGIVVVILAAVIIASSLGGGSTLKANVGTHASDVASVKSLLDGIPESGNVLGDPSAPVTVTEYGDLVCPICDEFAVGNPQGSGGSEEQFIENYVRTGKAKLVFRGLPTASLSNSSNASQYVNTQTSARSAGLQNLEWYYIMLTYEEQPLTVNGQEAETQPYVTTAYLQGLAEQVPGLNLISWQKNVSNPTLVNEVKADETAGQKAGVTGTPTVFATGPKGTEEGPAGVPTYAQLQTLVQSVS